MKIDIAESIREVLCDRHPVCIYGLGTLCLKQQAAQFGDKRLKLHPPRMQVEFNDETSDNQALLQWLSDKYEIRAGEARKAVKKFSESVLNTLLNYGKVYLPGIGLFERSEKGSIACDADASLTASFYKNFPVVDLPLPAQKDKETAREISEPKDIGKAAITSALIDELLQESPAETVPEKESEAEEELVKIEAEEPELDEDKNAEEEAGPVGDIQEADVSEDLSAEEMHVFDIDSELSKLKEELESEIQQKEQRSAKWRKSMAYLLIATSLIVAVILLVDACNSFFGTKNPVDKSENKALVANEIQAMDSLSAEMLKEASLVNGYHPDSCIIITGVFSASSNVEKMKQKLESGSYQSYEEQNGKFTRVGLVFDCNSQDLEAFIQKIRNEVSPKAWYLNPELYVAYKEK